MWPSPGLGLARGNRIERALGCLPSALACADPAAGAFSLLDSIIFANANSNFAADLVVSAAREIDVK